LDFEIYPDKLDKAIKDFSNDQEFTNFIKENKISELMKNYKDSNSIIEKSDIYINKIVPIFRILYQNFTNQFNEFLIIIQNKLNEYIPVVLKTISISKEFLKIDKFDLIIYLYLYNSNKKFLNGGEYDTFNDLLSVTLYPDVYFFSSTVCHELMHRFQREIDFRWEIYKIIGNNPSTMEMIKEIVLKLDLTDQSKEHLENTNDYYDLFYSLYFKNLNKPKEFTDKQIYYGLSEATAYGIQYYILKFFKQDADEISYWKRFFSWLDEDIILFFNNNIKLGMLKFWALYSEKYIKYCYELLK